MMDNATDSSFSTQTLTSRQISASDSGSTKSMGVEVVASYSSDLYKKAGPVSHVLFIRFSAEIDLEA